MAVKIQLRRDTAANWGSNNPVLAEGEIGVELDTKRMKVGDGFTHWNDLPYTFENYYVKIGETVANADKLDNQEGSYYTNASNLSAGTVPVERLSGTYNIDISGNAATATNADKVDNFNASQSPQANQIPVLNSSGQLCLPFIQTPILVNGQDMMSRTFYVDAENGDDNNDGSSSAPFKTIKKACDSVPVGGSGLIYLSGDYTLTQNVYLTNKIIYINVPDNSILKPTWYLYNNKENRLNSFNLKGSSGIIFVLHDGAKILLDDEGFDSSYSQNYGWFIQKYAYCVGFIAVIGSMSYTNKIQIEIAGTDSSPVFMSHGDLHSLEALVLHLWEVDIIKSGNGNLTSGSGVFGLKASGSSVKDSSGNSLEWSDVVSGIVKDANGVPRNIISNIVF